MVLPRQEREESVIPFANVLVRLQESRVKNGRETLELTRGRVC